MEDPNTIFRMVAIDEFAGRIFAEPHNQGYYRPPVYTSCRETTPSCEGEGEAENKNQSSALVFKFDVQSKDPHRGITFGKDRKRCDVYLPKDTISGVHFSLALSQTGGLSFNDTSTHGTWIIVNGQRHAHPRRQFTCLFKSEDRIEFEFGVDHTPRMSLQIPRRDKSSRFQSNLSSHLEDLRKAGPSINGLNLSSEATTIQPSRAQSPRSSPYYIEEENLGTGTYGTVHKCRDISTETVYAMKRFSKKMRKSTILREIDIMRNLSPHVSSSAAIELLLLTSKRTISCDILTIAPRIRPSS